MNPSHKLGVCGSGIRDMEPQKIWILEHFGTIGLHLKSIISRVVNSVMG